MVVRAGIYGAVAAGSLMIATTAFAQLLNPQIERRQGYDPQPMNFDLWCQETVRYSADRCAQRLAGDVSEFEEYRSLIERYELQYYMEQRKQAEALEQVDRDYGSPWGDYTDPWLR